MSWKNNLSKEQKKEIRKLFKVNPWWNLAAILFVLVWSGCGWVILKDFNLAINIACYICIGICIHGLANMMHEGSHGNLFRNNTLDRVMSFTLVIPSFLSAAAYKANHMWHHRYVKTKDDPDEFNNLTSNKFLLSLVFYIWLIIGSAIYLIHVPISVLQRGRKFELKSAAFEYSLLLLIYLIIFTIAVEFDLLYEFLHLWGIPICFSVVFANIRGWAEHSMTTTDSELTTTRTVTSTRLLSFLNINLNYHLEHHLYPTIPWYNLPKLHELLSEVYVRENIYIYKSYFLFLYDAIRIGVHGIAPPEHRR